MKVYVVLPDYDGEYGEPVGVYASEEQAKKAVEQISQKNNGLGAARAIFEFEIIGDDQ